MEQVNVGIVGLGNIGGGTMTIFAENAEQIDQKLGFRLRVTAVCDLLIDQKTIPAGLGNILRTNDWRQVVTNPDIHIVVELVGGTKIAAEVVNAAIDNGKSVVTANKELMGLCGAEIWSVPSLPEPTSPWKPVFAAVFRFTPCCAKVSRVTASWRCSVF